MESAFSESKVKSVFNIVNEMLPMTVVRTLKCHCLRNSLSFIHFVIETIFFEAMGNSLAVACT